MTKRKSPKPKAITAEPILIHIDWMAVYNEVRMWAEVNFQSYADDVLQETYLKMVEYNSNPDNPIGYFRTSAYHNYLKLIKPIPAQTWIDVDSDKILIEEIMQAVNHLPEFDRNAVILHYVYGFSIVLIARKTHIPVSVLYEAISQSKINLRSSFNVS